MRVAVFLMPNTTVKIVKEALKLSQESRALIVEKLLESLDYEERFEIDREWMDEISRRCREIDRKETKLISMEMVFSELEKKLA